MARTEQTTKFWRDPALYELAARAIAVVALLLPAEGAAVRWLAYGSAQLPNALPVAVSASLVDLTALGVSSVLSGTSLLLLSLLVPVILISRLDEPLWDEESAALAAWNNATMRLMEARSRRIVRPWDPQENVGAQQDPDLAAITRDLHSANEEWSRLEEKRRSYERFETYRKSRPRRYRWMRVAYPVLVLGSGVLFTLIFSIDGTIGTQLLAAGVAMWVLRQRHPYRHFGFIDVLPIVIVIVAIVIVPAGLGYQPPLAKVDLDASANANLPDGDYLMLGERDGAILLGACTPERQVMTVQIDRVVTAEFLPREQPVLPSYLDILLGAEATTGMSFACEAAAP